MKTDKVLKDMPLVRQNMQGINGREIGKECYERILFLLKQKGQNVDILPHLENVSFEKHELKILNERDVETKLLEPLLEKLGFTHQDWQRQLKVKIGRNERIIPDYVIFPRLERMNETGYWVWEAKHSIANSGQLANDFNQAKSYALRLQCQGLTLASKEGIWTCLNPFNFEEVKFWTWHQIQELETFNQIFSFLGKRQEI